jgi:hypothetical protein
VRLCPVPTQDDAERGNECDNLRHQRVSDIQRSSVRDNHVAASGGKFARRPGQFFGGVYSYLSDPTVDSDSGAAARAADNHANREDAVSHLVGVDMTKQRSSSRRGNAMLEFVFVGVPMLMVTISSVFISTEMWQYSCLCYATEETARYVTMHGAGCTQNGNTCSLTVGNVTTYFQNQALGLSPNQVNLTLTDSSGSTRCNPFAHCETSSSQFPASTANSVGSDITIKATYPVNTIIAMFWAASSAVYNLGATSTQRIVF